MPASLDSSRCQLVIIDDNDADRQLCIEALNEVAPGAWSFVQFSSADQAWTHLLAQAEVGAAADLVLCDLLLGGMAGDEFAARMREHPTLRHVPLILLSGVQYRPAGVQADWRCKPDGWDGFIALARDLARVHCSAAHRS